MTYIKLEFLLEIIFDLFGNDKGKIFLKEIEEDIKKSSVSTKDMKLKIKNCLNSFIQFKFMTIIEKAELINMIIEKSTLNVDTLIKILNQKQFYKYFNTIEGIEILKLKYCSKIESFSILNNQNNNLNSLNINASNFSNLTILSNPPPNSNSTHFNSPYHYNLGSNIVSDDKEDKLKRMIFQPSSTIKNNLEFCTKFNSVFLINEIDMNGIFFSFQRFTNINSNGFCFSQDTFIILCLMGLSLESSKFNLFINFYFDEFFYLCSGISPQLDIEFNNKNDYSISLLKIKDICYFLGLNEKTTIIYLDKFTKKKDSSILNKNDFFALFNGLSNLYDEKFKEANNIKNESLNKEKDKSKSKENSQQKVNISNSIAENKLTHSPFDKSKLNKPQITSTGTGAITTNTSNYSNYINFHNQYNKKIVKGNTKTNISKPSAELSSKKEINLSQQQKISTLSKKSLIKTNSKINVQTSASSNQVQINTSFPFKLK